MFLRPLGFVVSLSIAAAAAAQTIVLDPNVPDVAECHGILTQAILDHVKAAPTDPGADFEKWRRGRRTMVEMPPPIVCQSKLWHALQHGKGLFNIASLPEGTESISLAPADLELRRQIRAYAASVGPNLDVAGGESSYQGEVQIAANPNNPQQLVAGSNSFYRDPTPACLSPTGGAGGTDGTQSLFGSSDGGATWVYRCGPWPASLTGGVPSAAFWFGSDPAMAWDAQGHAYAAYMLLSMDSWGYYAGAAIVCYRSSDSGNSWNYYGTIVNHLSDGSVLDDKELITVDNSPGPASTLSHPGRVYAIWDANNVERVAHSDDGVTWTTVILPTPSFGLYDIGGDVKVGADGTVYAIWNRLSWSSVQSGEATVFSKSTDGGATWSAPVVVASENLFSFGNNAYVPPQDNRGINAFGSLDVDNNPASASFGNLYVAYADYPSATPITGDTNIYVRTSADGGATWLSAVKVNDDGGSATQFFPWLSVDPTDGTVNVSWYDTRADSVNHKAQVYYARSSNGGASFEANKLITDSGASWVNKVGYSDESSSDNHSVNANQYGDYSGIVAINRQVHPFWTDSRQFYPTAGDGRVEDCATATIVNCSAPAAMAAPSVAPIGSCTTGLSVSWSAPSGWGTNATGGAYSVYRSTSSALPAGATPLVSGLTTLSYNDTTGTLGTTYYYFVAAKNNCPGTALTPMSSVSPASAPSLFSNGVLATVSGTTTICAGGSTSVSATLTGTPPWNVTWSDGFTQTGIAASPAARTVSPSSTTTYTVTAVSNATCSGASIGAAIVTVNTPPATPIVTAGSATTFCDGGSVTLTSSSATGNQWLKDGVPIGGATSSAYTATAAGSYLVQVSVQACASATSAAVAVTVNANPPTPTIGAGGPTAFCEGGSVTLTSSAPDSNQWLKDGVAIDGATATTYIATASGSYTVQVSNANNCTSTSLPVIVIASPMPATPAITPPVTTQFCEGTSLTLTSSPGPGYQWFQDGSPIAGATNQTYAATAAGSYSVEAVAPGCISGMSSPVALTSLTRPAAPTITPGGPVTFCAGGSVTLTSSSATGNQWLKDGVAIGSATNATFIATISGTSTATLTDANGCTSVPSAAIVVTVNPIPPAPTISAGGPTTLCDGYSVTLTSSQAAGNQWYLNAVAIPGATSQTYTATTSGFFSVTATSSGCTSGLAPAVNVTVYPVPAAPTVTAGGPTTFCSGGSVTLTSSDPSVYTWYRNGVALGATSQSLVVTSSGSYTAAALNDHCAGPQSAAVTVTVNPLPPTPVAQAAGSTTLCGSGTVTLMSSAVTGNQWFNNGMAISGATGTTYVAGTAGVYTVTSTVNGCSSAPSAPVFVTMTTPPAKPTITSLSGLTNLCSGQSTLLQSSSGPAYQWFKDGVALAGQTAQTYLASVTGSYVVEIISGGCKVDSDPMQITVWPTPDKPTVTASGSINICAGASVTLTSSSATYYSWTRDGAFLASGNGYGLQQTLAVTDAGSYQVLVGNDANCVSVASDPIVVSVQPAFTITPSTSPTVCGTNPGVWLIGDGTVNQWYRNGTPISGGSAASYYATVSGTYTATSSRSCTSNAIAVHLNEPLPTPTITASGPTTFCAGGSVSLVSPTAPSYQWFDNGKPIAGYGNSQGIAIESSGSYTVQVSGWGCTSAVSAPVAVTVLPKADRATIIGSPFACQTSTLHSTWTSGNQWFLNGVAIPGATAQTYDATVTGSYTLQVTLDPTCGPSPMSDPLAVTIEPPIAKPTITASGPTAFCGTGSVTLKSSPALHYSWMRDGMALMVWDQTYVATQPGSYQVLTRVDDSACFSPPSDPINVSFGSAPKATLTAPAGIIAGATASASCSAIVGSTWSWSVTNGTMNGSSTGSTLSFTAPATGSVTLSLTVTNGGCIETKSASVPVIPNSPGMSFTAIAPNAGPAAGGTAFKITGSGFTGGATVLFDTTPATNVVVADGGTITGVSPSHDPGNSNLTVLNADKSGTGVVSGFFFQGIRFDPNSDGVVDPADIFYLVNYLFINGPAPQGWAGAVGSGDANQDGVVDPADIFYTVNYLFANGTKPLAAPAGTSISGAITLGTPVVRAGRTFVPVIVTTTQESAAPQAISLKLRVRGSDVTIRRAGVTKDLQPLFENAPPNGWLASFDAATAPIPSGTRLVVAEIETDGRTSVEIDAEGTMLCNQSGTEKATVENGRLRPPHSERAE